MSDLDKIKERMERRLKGIQRDIAKLMSIIEEYAAIIDELARKVEEQGQE